MRALVFGEILWDIFPGGKNIGGASFNFAVHFARCGGEPYLVSAVGNDGLGEEALHIVSRYGVRGDYIAARPGYETGRCLVHLDSHAIPHYDLLPHQAYDAIDYPAGAEGCAWNLLYFGTLALREEHNRAVISRIVRECRPREVFVDINLRAPYYDRATVDFALSRATVLKISEEELPQVLALLELDTSGEWETRLCDIAARYPGVRWIVLTRGDRGAVARRTSDGACWSCGAVPCRVVSTVGAGDSFSAAFSAAYLRGEEIPACLRAAAELAAETVSRYGAVPEL